MEYFSTRMPKAFAAIKCPNSCTPTKMDNPNKHLVHYRSVLRTLSDIFYVAFSEDVKDLTVKDGH